MFGRRGWVLEELRAMRTETTAALRSFAEEVKSEFREMRRENTEQHRIVATELGKLHDRINRTRRWSAATWLKTAACVLVLALSVVGYLLIAGRPWLSAPPS